MKKMQFCRRIVCLIVILGLLMGNFSAGSAQEYPFAGFTAQNAALKEKPSTSAKTLLTVPAGDSVYVTGEQSSYYIVEYEGSAGYIYKSYISVSQTLSADPTQVPASYEASEKYETLYINSSGAKVKALQEALQELGYYTGSADGIYGSGTQNAVRLFQQKNNLTADGAADAATQETLYEKKVVNASGKTVSVKTLAPVDGVSMSLGNKGDAVITLKNRLQELGYYTATAGNEFDSATKKALIAFQKKNNLYADGVLGDKTRAVLYSDEALTKAGEKLVSSNQSEEEETSVQLAEAVYPYTTTTNASVILRKNADASSARLTTIPKDKEIEVQAATGEFLKVTYNGKTGYIVAVYANIPAQYVTESQSKYPTLKNGDSSDQVTAVQQALKELGFYSGTVNGNYTSVLETAVKQFQKKNGYVQTGVLTGQQQEKLFEGKVKNSSGKSVSVHAVPDIDNFPMEKNDTGANVGKLQSALKLLGYYTGSITNTYDTATYNAVRAFQKAKGLTVDGKAGEKTQTLLYALAATPTPLPENYVAVEATQTPLTEQNVIVMQSGTRGVAVKNLQQKLVELGYYDITPDGIYNSDDIAAVRAFQKANGLTADGIAGLETQLVLFSDNAIAKATATPKAEVTPTPTPTLAPVQADTTVVLKMGSRGDDVKTLQTRLAELGFYTGSADGIFGSSTSLAVKNFQKSNGLTADGVAGQKTLEKLYSSAAATATPKPTATAKATTTVAAAASDTLMMGDKGDDVKKLQQRLVALGYLKKADGEFGALTFAAVVKFQQQNSLTVTGTINTETRKKLNSSSAKKASSTTTATVVTSSSTITVPSASEVRFANWYTEIRTRARAMPYVTLYDPTSGLYYNIHMFSFGKHADIEPVTAEDTAIMNKVCGTNSWNPHVVWVIFPDGRVYIASTHSHGHGVDHNTSNNLTGHVCLHFPREMDEAQATGPYAVSHQNAILNGWELVQKQLE